MSIPSRLLNSGKYVLARWCHHYFGGCDRRSCNSRRWISVGVGPMSTFEEIEIDAKVLRAGKGMAVVSVEFRKKKTGQIFAQGRHTKYISFITKM
ncbi:putative acyl-CoA hydrolase [Medicago truncatula]|uniref:Putative acyl-CoA hydrolase n=1 Tax=Medicago truncatula TaxID=3880 RepID=A0A396IWF6_MEDTR|nr:putative acyl-CoA hydrolase [Medicago truncatula]